MSSMGITLRNGNKIILKNKKAVKNYTEDKIMIILVLVLFEIRAKGIF